MADKGLTNELSHVLPGHAFTSTSGKNEDAGLTHCKSLLFQLLPGNQ